jgi:hypothetical protein
MLQNPAWSACRLSQDPVGAAEAKHPFDKAGTYSSHVDVVTRVEDRVATLIGGTASQTVKLTPEGFVPVRAFEFTKAGASSPGHSSA